MRAKWKMADESVETRKSRVAHRVEKYRHSLSRTDESSTEDLLDYETARPIKIFYRDRRDPMDRMERPIQPTHSRIQAGQPNGKVVIGRNLWSSGRAIEAKDRENVNRQRDNERCTGVKRI